MPVGGITPVGGMMPVGGMAPPALQNQNPNQNQPVMDQMATMMQHMQAMQAQIQQQQQQQPPPTGTSAPARGGAAAAGAKAPSRSRSRDQLKTLRGHTSEEGDGGRLHAPDDNKRLSSKHKQLGLHWQVGQPTACTTKFRISLCTACSSEGFDFLTLAQMEDEKVDLLCFNLTNLSPDFPVVYFGSAILGEIRTMVRRCHLNILRNNPSRLQGLSNEFDNVAAMAVRNHFPVALLSPPLRQVMGMMASRAMVMGGALGLGPGGSAGQQPQPTVPLAPAPTNQNTPRKNAEKDGPLALMNGKHSPQSTLVDDRKAAARAAAKLQRALEQQQSVGGGGLASDTASDGGSTSAETASLPAPPDAPLVPAAAPAVAWPIPPMNLAGLKTIGAGKAKAKGKAQQQNRTAGAQADESAAADRSDLDEDEIFP